jgi:3-oxoacid CoA-transferase
VEGEAVNRDVFNASGQYVSLRPGASFFDSVEAFEIARSGRLHAVVLGAYQVDQAGNLANYATPEQPGGGIGGAMDLVAGKQLLIVMMEHRDSRDRPKLVRRTAYPLTGAACVDVVVTDLAVLRRTGDDAWTIEEVAEGFSPDDVLALTEFEIGVESAR